MSGLTIRSLRVSLSANTPPLSRRNYEVACLDTTQRAIGGGANPNPPDVVGTGGALVGSWPHPTPHIWNVVLENRTTTSQQFDVYVVCVNAN
jgi:hypothetical protein